MRFLTLLSLSTNLLFHSAVCSQEQKPKPDVRVNSVLWTQSSPEYIVAMRQAYKLAKLQLDAGLEDNSQSADEVQRAEGNFSEKPPAIILDVDETVLDNSPFNARLIEDGATFNSKAWSQWISEAAAQPLPGAVEFIQYAQARDVAVYLVTNRADKDRDGTLRNIKRVGLSVPDNQVLLRNDEDGRGGSKVSRRAMVAAKHRIVLLIGDNIADLCAEVAELPAEEARLATANKLKAFANGWVMLPNPMYGGWERKAASQLRTLRPTKPKLPVASKPVAQPVQTPTRAVREYFRCPCCGRLLYRIRQTR